MPQSSIAEDESLVLDIEASLGTTEVFDLDDNDACETSTKASNDISIDLNNFMQEMEEERDSAMGSMSLHLVGGLSIGGVGADHSECDDEHCSHHHPQHIGSNLQLEDLPSSRQGFDSWWSSSSNNKGSFMGSFRKKMGSSFRLFHSSGRRKDKDASGKHNQSSPSSENNDHNDHHHNHDAHEAPQKRKKAVRFKKFDTIFPFYKSFSRVTVQTEEEEAYCTSNHDHDHHDDDHPNDHTTTTNCNNHHSS